MAARGGEAKGADRGSAPLAAVADAAASQRVGDAGVLARVAVGAGVVAGDRLGTAIAALGADAAKVYDDLADVDSVAPPTLADVGAFTRALSLGAVVLAADHLGSLAARVQAATDASVVVVRRVGSLLAPVPGASLVLVPARRMLAVPLGVAAYGVRAEAEGRVMARTVIGRTVTTGGATLRTDVVPQVLDAVMPIVADEVGPRLIDALVPHLTVVVPKLVDDLVPYLSTDLVPTVVDALIPYLSAELVPQVIDALVPYLAAKTVPDVIDAILPKLQGEIVPGIVADVVDDPRMQELILARTQGAVQDLTDEVRGRAERADDAVEARLRKLLRLRPARVDEGIVVAAHAAGVDDVGTAPMTAPAGESERA